MPQTTASPECVFCCRREQPAALFETPSFYIMPDKFPMQPGHTLVISKQHLACLAVAPAAALEELDAAAERVRRFLEAAYGLPVLALENGITGQTVFHAHLHLMPLMPLPLPRHVLEHPDVWLVDGWEEVREHFARHGNYRYLEQSGQRLLVAGHSLAISALRDSLAQATGLAFGPDGWIKTTMPEDVLEAGRRWGKWLDESG